MQRMSIEIVLPCGCAIRHASVECGDHDISYSASIEARFQHQLKTLARWFHQRLTVQDRHRCELVSITNPSGFSA